MAALLGTLVQSNAIQYNSSAINSTFYEVYNVQFLLRLPEMCKFSYMFIIEIIVKAGLLLNYIETCFYLFVLPIYLHEEGRI